MSEKKAGRDLMQPAHIFKNKPLATGASNPLQVEKIFNSKSAPALDRAVANENDALKKQVADLEAKIEKLSRGGKRELLARIAELEAENKALDEDFGNLVKANAENEARIAELEAALVAAKPEEGDGINSEG